MSEQQPQEQQKPQEEQQRGFGGRGGPRGGQRPNRPQRGGDRGAPRDGWNPNTKLGRLVKAGKITTIEEIFRWAMPIKEAQIVDKLIPAFENGKGMREEVMQVKPVQKQTTAGQRMRFKCYVIVGDCDGHLGLGWSAQKEVQGSIKAAITHAKLNLVPIRRGYWGNKIGNAHTIPCKVHGKCGSVRVRMIPAPRGTGLVAAPASKKVIQFAGIGDVYTSSSGCTRTRGNFVKAVYDALEQTYKYQTPDFWGKPEEKQHPYEEHLDFLSKDPRERE